MRGRGADTTGMERSVSSALLRSRVGRCIVWCNWPRWQCRRMPSALEDVFAQTTALDEYTDACLSDSPKTEIGERASSA